MGLETGTFIDDLVETNPVGTSDFVSQGDNHIRLIKSTIKNSFPNITGAMNRSHTQLNNAPDKTSNSESISGEWTFVNRIDFTGGMDVGGGNLEVLAADLFIRAGTPTMFLVENDATADNGIARFAMSGERVEMRLVLDDASLGEAIFTSTRNAGSVGITNFNGVMTYGGIEVGFRDAVRTTGSFSSGHVRPVNSSLTIEAGASDGEIFGLYNNSAGSITLSQGTGLTLRLSGTSTTGNRTLAPRTLAVIWANSSSEYIVSGLGVT